MIHEQESQILDNFKNKIYSSDNWQVVKNILSEQGVSKYEIYFKITKEGQPKAIVWLSDLQISLKNTHNLIFIVRPSQIKCEYQRPQEEGTYAAVQFALTPDIDITGIASISGYLGNLEKELLETGYQKQSVSTVGWGACLFVLPKNLN